MRSVTVLALAATLLVAGCGDEPEPQPMPTRPTPQRPAAQADSPAASPDTTAVTRPATPTRPTGEAAEGTAVREGQRLYTVQVAAFTNPESARLWTGRLVGQGLPVWTSVSEQGGQTYHRVRVGAVPTVAEARQLGAMLNQRYEWPVWVAPLTPADRVPADAVERTRRLLNGR